MPETRAAKEIFKWDPITTRPRGRPKYIDGRTTSYRTSVK